MSYLPRIADGQLERLLAQVPAVAIDGPRAVGKSSTAGRLAASSAALDLDEDRELLDANPARLEEAAKPLLLDEWQRLPVVWDRVRRAVDAGAAPGSFILTGSAAPARPPTHTGAGRIVRLRMRPMTLAERRVAEPAVSLGELLAGGRPAIGGESPMALGEYAEEIAATGFPGIRAVPAPARTDILDGYLAGVVERDFPEAGRAVRRPTLLRAWLRSFAAATSTTASYTAILDAATPGDADKPSKATAIAYRDVLEQMWLLDELPAWGGRGGRGGLGTLARAPKHQLADPGLAARLLGVGAGALLDRPNPDRPARPRGGTLLGALFEGLATLCVRVFAEASRARVSHLRSAGGAREIDLIVEREDGRVLPIEVKLSASVTGGDVAHLAWLRDALPGEVIDAAVLTTGRAAYRRPDGIAVVPLALLGV